MKRLFLITLSAFAGVACCFAQPNLPAKCQASLPRILTGIILSENNANTLNNSRDFGQSNAVGKYWIAYSDRDNNTTYMEPNASSAQCSALRFNETVRIAKIQNGFALVYVEPNKQLEYPLISADAKCRGWVPMKKLLLWNSCLANEKGIYNKALLCVNLDKSSSQVKNFGSGYFGPSTSSSEVQLTTDMNFYYIMKRENGMTLLASQSKMDGAFSDQVLFCWVPEQSFVPWNQRSCLEPTWKHEDVEYFAAKDIKVSIYKNDKFDSKAISNIPFKKRESATYDQYLYRMSGSSLRFPILDNGSKGVYNMSTFSTIGGQAEGTGTPGDGGGLSKADSIMLAQLNRMLNINLAIVIDGTSSMEPYYPAVKEAIKSGIQYFSQNYKIKVGIVIYRDYADGEAGLVEVMPLTNAKNMTRINGFLDSGGRYGIRSSANDKTQTEALYYGLNEALDKLRFREGESNIMLVVGDCGNDANDTKCANRDDIVSKIVANKMHVMGFQVQNRNVPAFNSFNNQLLYILRNSLLANYKKYDANIKVSSRQTKNAAGTVEGYNYIANVERQLYIGNHRFADANVDNGKMDPKMLTGHMTSAISDFASKIQTQIDIIVNKARPGAQPPKPKPEGTILTGDPKNPNGSINIDDAFIRETLGPEWAEAMKGSKALVNFRGYAKKKDDSGRDFFKPVIFISMEEFDDLLKRLAPVSEAALSSNVKDRTPYIEAMKALVRSLVPGISDGDMAKLSNGEITAMIGGLNEAAGALKTYTLDDLSNQTVIPAAEYQRIITDFSRKFKNLSRIRASKSYKFVKEFNSAKYYWIPIEDLP